MAGLPIGFWPGRCCLTCFPARASGTAGWFHQAPKPLLSGHANLETSNQSFNSLCTKFLLALLAKTHPNPSPKALSSRTVNSKTPRAFNQKPRSSIFLLSSCNSTPNRPHRHRPTGPVAHRGARSGLDLKKPKPPMQMEPRNSGERFFGDELLLNALAVLPSQVEF